MNNFRQNLQGEGIFNAPDLTVSLEARTTSCPTALELQARVTNQGTFGVPSGVKVSFWLLPSAENGLIPIATTPTTKALLPGGSQQVTAMYKIFGGKLGPHGFRARVDDDGAGKGVITECREDNNQAEMKGVKCQSIK